MNCVYCAGELEPGTIDFTQSKSGCDVIFHNLPAQVCTQCKEALLEEDTIMAIQDVLSNVEEKITPLRAKIAA